MNRDEVVKRLHELYAEEVETAIRYLHLAVTIRGLDRLVMQEPLRKMLEETLTHARVVAERILQLGEAPRLDLKLCFEGEFTTGSEAVRTAVSYEREALEAYRELLEDVEGHIELEEFARAQVSFEARHLAELRLLLEDDA
jgi:bacterioferritin